MTILQTRGLTHRYGRRTALADVDISVEEGSVYALLGANGAGKTTLLRILAGVLRPSGGEVEVFGTAPWRLSVGQRAMIGYVAEGLELPKWMTLRQYVNYLAPLYPTWDEVLAEDLRARFRLEYERKIGSLSRGDYMKVMLLGALAFRPPLLLMDEPFTGVDVVVKDQLVRGLLDIVAEHRSTVVIASHDLAEVEPLADWVGFLDASTLRLSEPMESLRERFVRVEVTGAGLLARDFAPPRSWRSVERTDSRVAFLLERDGAGADATARTFFPPGAHVEMRPATLREVFVALATEPAAARGEVVGA